MNKKTMFKHITLYACTFFLVTSATGYAFAQNTNKKEPIEITADNTLEWHRNDNFFVAKGNALAVQGDVSIAGQTLSAKYRKTEASSMDLYQMNADKDVIVTSNESQAFGEHATYNIDDGLAIMTGDNLKLISPDQTLTARDQFEYYVTDGKLIAIGDAKVVRPKPEGGTDILEADKVSATFIENERGERVLKEMDATSNVVITTPTEIITGAYGIYKADTNKADLTGGVTIRRGPNILEGERAEVDLNTNTSRLFSSNTSTGNNGRVRGVFYPGSEDKKEP